MAFWVSRELMCEMGVGTECVFLVDLVMVLCNGR